MMRTLTSEAIEFGNFILIASIHLWNQSTENFMSSSPLGCDIRNLADNTLATTSDRLFCSLNFLDKLWFSFWTAN